MVVQNFMGIGGSCWPPPWFGSSARERPSFEDKVIYKVSALQRSLPGCLSKTVTSMHRTAAFIWRFHWVRIRNAVAVHTTSLWYTTVTSGRTPHNRPTYRIRAALPIHGAGGGS